MPIFENFISYRRKETMLEVKNLYDNLKNRGFSTFCDIYSLDNGNFDENLIKYIKCCTNFLLVINNHSLDRCSEKGDWLLREIKQAIDSQKNIILILVGEVDFHNLPEALSQIKRKNGLKFDVMYFDSFLDALMKRFIVSSIDWEPVKRKDFVIQNKRLIKYLGTSKHIEVPDDVEIIENSAFKDNTSICEIVFNNHVKEIQDSAFERCISLSHIEIPNSVKILGIRTFARCYSLVNVVFNDCLLEIKNECFSFCTKLKIISLPRSLTAISSTAFNGCSLLTQIDVEAENERYCSENGVLFDKFKQCLIRCPANYQNNYLVLPNGIDTIGEYALSKCTNLTDIVLPSSLRTIQAYAFEECQNISIVRLPKNISSFAPTALKGWTSEQIVIFEDGFNRRIKRILQDNLANKQILPSKQSYSSYMLVKTTFESENEAVSLAHSLIKNRLIVSGQITKIRSIYHWDGKVNDENEFELSCITSGYNYPEIENFINSHHSYELCELISIPIEHTPKMFGDWITGYVAKEECPMIGIVGKLLIRYTYENKEYEQSVDLCENSNFSLQDIGIGIEIVIEEITYIEDTIYGVELSVGDDSWWVSGNTPIPFSIEKNNIFGTFELAFIK